MFLAIIVTCPFHNINLFIIFIIISMMYSLLSSLLQYNNRLYFSFFYSRLVALPVLSIKSKYIYNDNGLPNCCQAGIHSKNNKGVYCAQCYVNTYSYSTSVTLSMGVSALRK